MIKIRFFLSLALVLSFTQSWASDKLKLEKITNNVYAIIGETVNRTPENLGNNATFGFVVTDEGVVLIDSGGTYKGAKALEEVIKTVTDKPVTLVINTGGQDHRWLGNDYFKKKGAEIVASKAAVKDQKKRTQDQFFMLGNTVGESALVGTDPVYAGTTFEKKWVTTKGGITFEVYYEGTAHTPGDSYVWMPKEEIMFAGDIVFIERMLGVGPMSNSKSWVSVYESMAAFKPKHLVPGHGSVTTLAQSDKDTYGYLKYLRKSVSDFIENNGDITEISSVDVSKFDYLKNYKLISGKNSQQVFIQMEWE